MARKRRSGRNSKPERGSYNPDWYKRSAIIIPNDGRPIPPNPVVDAIMGIDRHSTQTVEESSEESIRGESSS